MDEDIRKYIIFLIFIIILLTLLNIKLANTKFERIKKPVREHVSVIMSNDIIYSDIFDNIDDNLPVIISHKNKKFSFSNKLDWPKILEYIYARLRLNETIIVALKPTDFSLFSSIIKLAFPSTPKPIIIISNELDFNCAIKLISKYIFSYIISIKNGTFMLPDKVTDESINLGTNCEPNEEFIKSISNNNKEEKSLYNKKINIRKNVNLIKLHHGMTDSQIILCSLMSSDALVIDNTVGVDMVLEFDDKIVEKIKNIKILLVGKKLSLKSNLNILYDPNISPEFALAKLYF